MPDLKPWQWWALFAAAVVAILWWRRRRPAAAVIPTGVTTSAVPIVADASPQPVPTESVTAPLLGASTAPPPPPPPQIIIIKSPTTSPYQTPPFVNWQQELQRQGARAAAAPSTPYNPDGTYNYDFIS